MDYSAFPLELKALSEAGAIEGLAAGYGNLDAGGDIVAPGAFAESLNAHKAAGTMPGMLLHCQSASKMDPPSACKSDPLCRAA